MAPRITHSFVSSKPVGNDSSRIYSDSWNDEHVITGLDSVSVMDFDAAADGITDDTLAIQQAIDSLAATGGEVIVPKGTYRTTGNISMRPNVFLVGAKGGTTIKQGNSAQVPYMFEFQSHSANNSGIINCIIDGNRTFNSDNDNYSLLYIYDANDVTIVGNTIQNATGSGVLIRMGARPRVERNTFSNIRALGIGFGVAATSYQNAMCGNFNWNEFISPVGQHAIYGQWADYNSICGNKIIGSQAIGVCNTSGTTVTWVSGTDFTTITAGEFITINAIEYLITAKASASSITIASSAGTQSSKAFVAGTGDIITIGNCSFNDIAHNIMSGGCSIGVGIHNFFGHETAQKNSIRGNIISRTGQCGIGLETLTTSPATQLLDSTITDNSIYDCALGAAANDTRVNCGIAVLDFNPAILLNTQIFGNYVRDAQLGGSPTMSAGIVLTSISNGQAFCGQNTMLGCTNNGITNGIAASLGAGWGSTASVSSIISHGDSFRITVAPSGSGLATFATITVTTPATSLTQPPIMNAKAIDANGVSSTVTGDTSATATGLTLAYAPAPTSGVAVTITCR